MGAAREGKSDDAGTGGYGLDLADVTKEKGRTSDDLIAASNRNSSTYAPAARRQSAQSSARHGAAHGAHGGRADAHN